VKPSLIQPNVKRVIPWEERFIMSEEIKAYIAGFLDGDGCLMAQLIKRKGYKFGFQIRLSLVFYQHKQNIRHLEWLKSLLKTGYIRTRNDNMAEYTIVGIMPVITVVHKILPYLRLKKKQAQNLLLFEKIPPKPSKKQFISFCQLVDNTAKYNFSKKRKNFTPQVLKYLTENNLSP